MRGISKCPCGTAPHLVRERGNRQLLCYNCFLEGECVSFSERPGNHKKATDRAIDAWNYLVARELEMHRRSAQEKRR